MSCKKKAPLQPHNNSYDSLYLNPLTQLKLNRSDSDGCRGAALITPLSDNKENELPPHCNNHNNKPKAMLIATDDQNAEPNIKKESFDLYKEIPHDEKKKMMQMKARALKPSSLQLCMQMNEPDFLIGPKSHDPIDSDNSSSLKIWDYSDSEAAPAASWSTLPNRTLLCRPLPVDIVRCTCIIVKEKSIDGGSLYTLYTNEGHGRQNRKLAVARHKRRNGRSEFVVAQTTKGILCMKDDSFVGIVTSNLMGSKYNIWDQGNGLKSMSSKHSKLLASLTFFPTITSWSGCCRSIKVWIPKHQSMQLKNTSRVQDINGLPKDWEEKMDKVHQLFSRVPHYSNNSKHYELDFRERTGKTGPKIQSSIKNFQLTLEKHGKQAILQLGRVGKLNYVMDYRYPLTGYQAFCICLASIDSKLCCTM